jgi:YD repeat-containing protein
MAALLAGFQGIDERQELPAPGGGRWMRPLFEAPPEAPPAEPGSARGCGVEDPVPNLYLHSGELYVTAVDLRIPGRGLDLVWARKYRSRLGPRTAQGNGWDFSYGIRIRQEGQALRLFDGNTRRDLYRQRADGTFVAREHFREGRFEPDGAFTLAFADGGTWSFRPLDASPAAGKIASSIDRNGNALQFQYDGAGRLVQVIDTLGRELAIAYDANGFIRSVTDWSGRSVIYAYYGLSEPGGSFGDLKSVTAPAVSGFPSGKTTTYTYSTGFADERLNHNLLTITDAKGQTWLVNTYAATQDPRDLRFDRVVRQQRGAPGEDVKIETELVPLALTSIEPLLVIVNDRVGNVIECSFDRRGRMIRELELTGRADPSLSTTSTSNRPASPLRGDDPPAFETRYRYNADSLVTHVVHPNGNVTRRVYELELDPAAAWRTRGNLRELRRTSGTHVPAGDQAELLELYEYEVGMGGCCGVSFVKRHVDARGNETLHDYDAAGNRIRTRHRIATIVEDWEYDGFGRLTAHVLPENGGGHRRRDEFRYYGPADGAQNGYLAEAVVDAGGLALTTRYEYDALGNVVRRTDPRGHDELLVVNALNQVEAERSREWTAGSGIYTWKYRTYDANDNLVRLDVENRDETGVLQPNALLTTTWTHGVLNEILRETREVDPLEDVVTEYAYDANRNRTLVRKGEAVNGNQPANTETTRYDERNLVFQVVRAAGDPAQSTTQVDYDGNRNVRARRAGLEGGAHVTLYVHDGFDRRASETDPMGNVAEYRYDANGNLGGDRSPGVPHAFGVRILGELVDAPGSAANVRLAQATYAYDAMDRLVRETVEHFDPATQAPISDGQRSSTREWADIVLTGPLTAPRKDMLEWYLDLVAPSGGKLDQVLLPPEAAGLGILRHVDDHGHATEVAYDTANRVATITDAAGNATTLGYDANGNVTSIVEVDVSDLGSPDRIVTTSFLHDGLDRLLQRTDGLGNATRYAYDSRGNRVRETDPRGNVTSHAFDGLDRRLESELTLSDTGTGAGTPIGSITTSQAWDASSRLVRQVDGNGNVTQHVYDALDRRILTSHADGTQHRVLAHDAHDRELTTQDPNGSVVANAYDGLDRLTDRGVAPGAGVSSATTFEGYCYDGLSRLVRAEDDDALVTLEYDSLGNVLCETSQVLPAGLPQTVIGTYDAVGLQTRVVYPGGRTIERDYDELERAVQVRDVLPAAVIADSWFQGPTLERRDLGNGTRLDATYDGVRRVLGMRHSLIGSGTTLDQRVYAWDPSSNKDLELDLVGGIQRTYAYDSADRLIRSRELPSGTTIDYVLDAAGNRQAVLGGPGAGPYTCDPTLPFPADCQVNQPTTAPGETLQHDANGNLVQRQSGPDVTTLSYDYRNRLVEVVSSLQGFLGAWRHDCFDRRIERATPLATVRTVHDGALEIEDQDAAGATLATVVHDAFPLSGFFAPRSEPFRGQPLDLSDAEHRGPIQSQRFGQAFFLHGDDLGSTVLVTDAHGACVERARYGDFGETTHLDCTLAPVPSSLSGIPYLYRGWHEELKAWDRLYASAWRHYAPGSGRHLQRDADGLWGDGRNLGNPTTLANHNPLSPRGQDPAEPRPSVATVDSRAAVPGVPSSSFFDVFLVLDPEATTTPPRAPPCEGPCEATGPVHESGPVNVNSRDSVKSEAQAKACKAAEADENIVRAAANDFCRAAAGHTSCICKGGFQSVPDSRTEVWGPAKARHGMGFGKTTVVYYSCQLRFEGQCEMSE